MFFYNFSPPSSVISISGPKASAHTGHGHDPARKLLQSGRILGFKSYVNAKLLFKDDTFFLMTTVMCVMLYLLIHSLTAALKLRRNSLVIEFFSKYFFLFLAPIPLLRLKKGVKIAKPASARTYASVFDYCAGRCRHSSARVVHENAYLSDFHHCFLLPSNSSVVLNEN
ncbi:hypothetical protein K1719_043571 [Acacia pycnantha]|nr:hypothetical protein K1719_043571 [Acacia pycnantha]